jgi:hypothetical protein
MCMLIGQLSMDIYSYNPIIHTSIQLFNEPLCLEIYIPYKGIYLVSYKCAMQCKTCLAMM